MEVGEGEILIHSNNTSNEPSSLYSEASDRSKDASSSLLLLKSIGYSGTITRITLFDAGSYHDIFPTYSQKLTNMSKCYNNTANNAVYWPTSKLDLTQPSGSNMTTQ